MNAPTMTARSLHNAIEDLCRFPQGRDAETYLLALLRLVEQHKDAAFTPELMMDLLGQAFTAEPAEYNPEWQRIGLPPDLYVSKVEDPDEEPMPPPHEYTIAVLKFQIAELHSMRGKQLENEWRYFGVTSDAGYSWYNFDQLQILECGARCILDGVDDENAEFEIDWSLIGELLNLGRIYE